MTDLDREYLRIVRDYCNDETEVTKQDRKRTLAKRPVYDAST